MDNNQTKTVTIPLSHVVVDFRYQSQNITFPEWISLFTLCLAPLLLHIFAGTPTPVLLHPDKPRWHDIMVHYNPTSIIWRYFSIINRRLRTRNWDLLDVAISNAHFWNGERWDGSEQTIVSCRNLCTKIPPSVLGRLWSIETVSTIIASLQGAQAIYLVYMAEDFSFALDSVFMPVAILGLLRLPAALWLTEHYEFAAGEGRHHLQSSDQVSAIDLIHDDNKGASEGLSHQPRYSRIPPHPISTPNPTNRNGWIAIPSGLVIRGIYIGLLAALVYRTLQFLLYDGPATKSFNALIFAISLFYLLFLVVPTLTYIYYFLRSWKSSPSTIIPCISHLWYKIYTCIMLLAAVGVVVIAALQTRKSPCGTYTVFGTEADPYLCPGITYVNATESR